VSPCHDQAFSCALQLVASVIIAKECLLLETAELGLFFSLLNDFHKYFAVAGNLKCVAGCMPQIGGGTESSPGMCIVKATYLHNAWHCTGGWAALQFF